MPRRSSASLSVLPSVDGRPTRIRPPADMDVEAAALFKSLVASEAPEHFKASDAPLLRQYCEAIRLAEQAGDELRSSGAVIGGRASPWLVVAEKAQRAMVALSMRLRLSPQSRLDPKTTARMRGAVASAYDNMEHGHD